MHHGVEELDEYPIAAFCLTILLAAVAYVAVSYLLDGVVTALETGVFAVVFAAVYLGVTWYLDRD